MFSFDWSILQQSLPLLGQGAMVTLKITRFFRVFRG